MNRKLFYKLINSCSCSPYEEGGIIGAYSDIVVTFFADSSVTQYGKYTPNTNSINKKILEWDRQDIEFYGIYHSHYPNGKDLSCQDVEYIEKIMKSMAGIYDVLYFPIVIPKKSIYIYKAERLNGRICINNDELVLIN